MAIYGQRYEWSNQRQFRRLLEKSTGETISVDAPVYRKHSFAVGAAGTAVHPRDTTLDLYKDGSGFVWQVVQAGTSNAAVIEGREDIPPGRTTFRCSTASETQEVGVTFGDRLLLDPNKKLNFEIKMKVKVPPSAASKETLSFGLLFGNWIATSGSTFGPATVAKRVLFRLDYSASTLSTLAINTDDNTRDVTGTYGTTIADEQELILRVDMSSLSNVKFYLNGARILATTTFNMSGLGASDFGQPFIAVSKYNTPGAAVPELDVEYLSYWATK